MEKENLKLMM